MAALITCRQVGTLSNHPAPNHTEQLISFWQMGVFWDGLKICKEMVFQDHLPACVSSYSRHKLQGAGCVLNIRQLAGNHWKFGPLALPVAFIL